MSRTMPRIRPSGAVLPVIAGLFLASGLIRFGGGTAQALTEEIRHLAAQSDATQEIPAEPCPPPPDIAAVLSALQTREAEIELREVALDEREATLDIAREEIARQMAALEAAEAALESTITIADEAAESDIARLTAVYENMKAEEAAALFAEMDPDFAAGFLGRMRADAAAAVMAGLDPTVAYSISVILAGRNARAPKE
ncbi:MotE family protein [Rhodovulum euryhalinum]|uniref:Flagellar motility protein MotE (MotC chaperone) n=1 Tax=Rhodovulum euryhalinum TaxID=35805 RepID=A0A4R2KJD7_9RHOB|nr:hypothetical protein [Rhodovulum euryhalinum]TCO73374.1 flagellar motility protein MotE (MotC chaperone) [Rhodovulum euryhalinum]